MSKGIPYTAEQDAWLKEHINDCKWDELTLRFVKHFGIPRTKTALKRHCWGQLNLISNRNGNFQKGQSPYNVKPIGAEHWENGYLWVKVNNAKSENKNKKTVRANWKMKHVLIYEEAYGKIPDKAQVVFLDGDKTNFALDNLYCVSLAIMAVMNRNKWFTSNRENTLTAIKWCELHFAMKGVKDDE